MKYRVYYSSERGDLDRVKLLLAEQGEDCEVFDVATSALSSHGVQQILDVLGLWAVDLVDTSHMSWTDSHLNEESDDGEIVEYIASEPAIIRTPFVIKDGKGGVMCEPPENIFSLFS